MINTVIYGFFAFFVILGFLLGLKRGMTKSIIRIISVILCAILVVFLTPVITNSILNFDISSSGIDLGGVTVTTVNDTIINYLKSMSIVGEVIEASPTLQAVILGVPAVIINLLLFGILFFLFKAIFYIIDIILNRIIIKKSDPPKNKHRWIGSAIGAVQGVIVFLVFMIPIAGTFNMALEANDILEDNNVSISNVVSATTMENEYRGSEFPIAFAEEETDITSNNELNIGITDYKNNIVLKVFNTIGYKAITNGVYDNLTTIKVDDETKITLKGELLTVANIYVDYTKVQDMDINNLTNDDITALDSMIDDVFNSKIIANTATELIVDASRKWTATNPTQFLGMDKPVLSDELVGVFDCVLTNLRTVNETDLKSDMKVFTKSLKVVSDYGVIEKLNGSSTDEIVDAIGQDGFIENLFGAMTSGKLLKNVLPTVVETGFNYTFSALNIDDKVTITTSANEIDWDREKVIQGNIFEGIAKTYKSTQGEGDILEKIDLASFGSVLNNMRSSQLLGESSQKITVNLLSSKMLSGVNVDSLLANVNNKSVYETMDFEIMLTTLKSSANIATKIGSEDGISNQDISGLIKGLTEDPTTSDILTDLVSVDNLTKAGVDIPTAGAVSELVNAIANYDTTEEGAVQVPESDEEVEAATGAVEELLSASKNAKSTGGYIFGEEETDTKEKMRTFLDNMMSSEFIYQATINRGEELGFKYSIAGEPITYHTKLSSDEVGWMNEVLEESAYSGIGTKKSEIKTMFAIN